MSLLLTFDSEDKMEKKTATQSLAQKQSRHHLGPEKKDELKFESGAPDSEAGCRCRGSVLMVPHYCLKQGMPRAQLTKEARIQAAQMMVLCK